MPTVYSIIGCLFDMLNSPNDLVPLTC